VTNEVEHGNEEPKSDEENKKMSRNPVIAELQQDANSEEGCLPTSPISSKVLTPKQAEKKNKSINESIQSLSAGKPENKAVLNSFPPDKEEEGLHSMKMKKLFSEDTFV
jgi:hypothetical protein